MSNKKVYQTPNLSKSSPKDQSRSGSVPKDDTFGNEDVYNATSDDQFENERGNRAGAEAWEGYMGQDNNAPVGYPDKDSAYPSDADPGTLEFDPSNVID